MSWNYATLSHMAKICGGPEALVKTIENRGLQTGFLVGAKAGIKVGIKTGKIQMIPIILLASAFSAAISAEVIIVMQNRKEILPVCGTKFRKTTQEEYEAAKESLIQGIEDYDKAHSGVESADELAESPNATMD